jgi:hypothetical protein
MPLRFRWKEAPVRIKNAKDADPQKLGEALMKVQRENGGLLTKADALKAARDRRNAMHRHLEWNDKVAADKHRMSQIGELIRIIIRDDPADETVVPHRAFLSVNDNGTAYRGIDEVLRNQTLQLAVWKQALRELRAFETRYAELLSICELVRSARERLSEQIQQAEARPQ